MAYEHLGLREWPFRVVPEPEFCDFLADRTVLRNDVQALLSTFDRRPTSDIHLLWSWYGAGKTHTLYYIANQCAKASSTLLPLYVELPREARGFIDLYRVTVSQIAIELILDAFLEFTTRPSPKAGFSRVIDPDLNSALTQAVVGERSIQTVLGQWLLGNTLPAASLRQLGVGAQIRSTEKSGAILADIIGLLAPRANGESQPGKRVIWIIDEVQRVGEGPSGSAKRSTLSGMVGVFNRCPTGLTMILSYTGRPTEKTLPDWIPADLADRIGLERPLLLPDLRSDEALDFVKEVLAHFRIPEANVGPFFPFAQDAVESLLKALGRTASILKPRTIMEALDASLRTLEPRFRAGDRREISIPQLRESLGRMTLDWSDGRSGRRGKA